MPQHWAFPKLPRYGVLADYPRKVGLCPASGKCNGTPLHCDPQFDTIVRRMDQILLRSQVSFGRLHRRVAQQQLDLFKLAAARPAHLRAATTSNNAIRE
jgi:hypothetical protein